MFEYRSRDRMLNKDAEQDVTWFVGGADLSL